MYGFKLCSLVQRRADLHIKSTLSYDLLWSMRKIVIFISLTIFELNNELELFGPMTLRRVGPERPGKYKEKWSIWLTIWPLIALSLWAFDEMSQNDSKWMSTAQVYGQILSTRYPVYSAGPITPTQTICLTESWKFVILRTGVVPFWVVVMKVGDCRQ